MYDLILTYILKKFNRFKSVLHIKKRSAKSAFCFGGPTGTSFLNFSRHKCVSFVCALKNSSVTATTRSPKESLNAGFESLCIENTSKRKKVGIKPTFFVWWTNRFGSLYELFLPSLLLASRQQLSSEMRTPFVQARSGVRVPNSIDKTKSTPKRSAFCFGGPTGTRTPDRPVMSRLL